MSFEARRVPIFLPWLFLWIGFADCKDLTWPVLMRFGRHFNNGFTVNISGVRRPSQSCCSELEPTLAAGEREWRRGRWPPGFPELRGLHLSQWRRWEIQERVLVSISRRILFCTRQILKRSLCFCFFSSLPSGDESSATLEDLRPATDYHIRFTWLRLPLVWTCNEHCVTTVFSWFFVGCRPCVTVYREAHRRLWASLL